MGGLLSEDEQMRAVCGPEVMRRNDLEHASERKPLPGRTIHPFLGLDSQGSRGRSSASPARQLWRFMHNCYYA